MKLSSTKLKKRFIFQEGTCKVSKEKKSHFLFVETELFKHKHKRKKMLILSLIKKGKKFLN